LERLGLIVTARHQHLEAWLTGRAEGEILVSYDARDSGWRLSVSDNGSGLNLCGLKVSQYMVAQYGWIVP
jgi:hypothetical protein